MGEPAFFHTVMGRKFFEATLPDLVRQIARLADAAERIARALEGGARTPGDDGRRQSGAGEVSR